MWQTEEVTDRQKAMLHAASDVDDPLTIVWIIGYKLALLMNGILAHNHTCFITMTTNAAIFRSFWCGVNVDIHKPLRCAISDHCSFIDFVKIMDTFMPSPFTEGSSDQPDRYNLQLFYEDINVHKVAQKREIKFVRNWQKLNGLKWFWGKVIPYIHFLVIVRDR